MLLKRLQVCNISIRNSGKSRKRSLVFIDSLARAHMRGHLGALKVLRAMPLLACLLFHPSYKAYLAAKAYFLSITIFLLVISSASTCDHETGM